MLGVSFMAHIIMEILGISVAARDPGGLTFLSPVSFLNKEKNIPLGFEKDKALL
jgi:hypothetical protein